MSRRPFQTVLLVEDSPGDAALAFHVLAQEGFEAQVAWAADGSQALDMLLGPDSHEFRRGLRVVLLDIKLPKLNGIEVLRLLRADPRSSLLPVVMLTSSAEPRDISACYEIGANGYLVKGAGYEAYTGGLVQAVRYWTQANTPPPVEAQGGDGALG